MILLLRVILNPLFWDLAMSLGLESAVLPLLCIFPAYSFGVLSRQPPAPSAETQPIARAAALPDTLTAIV